LAAVALGAFLYITSKRVGYPFDLEWCESPDLHIVQRILQGKAVYAAPSMEFVSFAYTPFYFYISALSSLPLGLSYLPLRMVSLTASLCTVSLIFLFVKRETGNRLWSCIAAGLFAATNGILSGWFDLARVDALFVALLMASIYVLRFHGASGPSAVLAGLLLFLTWFTKQSVAGIIPPLMLYLLVIRPRYTLIMGAVFLSAVMVSTLVLDGISDGWFLFYSFDLLRHHKLLPEQWLGYWQDGVFGATAPMMTGAILFVIAQGWCGAKDRLFYPALLAGLLGGCWMSRLHQGSAINSLLPLYAFAAIMFAISIYRLLRWSARFSGNRQLAVHAAACMFVAVQFCMLRYSPGEYIPPEKSREEGAAFVHLLAALKETVYIPCNTSFALLAGKAPYADFVPTWDILRTDDKETVELLSGLLRDSFCKGTFQVVISHENSFFRPLLPEKYIELKSQTPAFMPLKTITTIYIYMDKDAESRLRPLFASVFSL